MPLDFVQDRPKVESRLMSASDLFPTLTCCEISGIEILLPITFQLLGGSGEGGGHSSVIVGKVSRATCGQLKDNKYLVLLVFFLVFKSR